MKRFVVVLVAVAMCLGFISAVYAGNPGDKLARGITNSLSGLLEIPLTIGEEWKASNNAGIGIFVGLFKGFFWAIGRTCSGLYDILTFPIPLPKDYDSLMKPDYVWRTEPTHLITDQPAAPGKPTPPARPIK